jgi:hypothetical protein
MAVHAAFPPLAAIVKFVLGAGASVGAVYIVRLRITVVRDRARKMSRGRKVTVRRERERHYIRIVLEASGERAVWLAEKLDEALEKLLPKDGVTAEI